MWNRKRSILFPLTVALLVGGIGAPAWADRGHSRGPAHHERHYRGGHGAGWVPGLLLGSAIIWAATRPPVIYTAPAAPQVVIVPSQPAASPPVENWYYCRPAEAYYPYVPSCPTPWELVPGNAPGQ
jgi:hypothetical protein